MAVTKVQLVSNIIGNVSGGASFSGIVTATSFSGNVTGNATGLSGTPNITVGNVIGSAATFTNLTVNGTQTIINTTSLEIADKAVGIASTSSPTDANADGAGIVVYGTTNKSLTWSNTSKNWGLVGGGLTVASGPFIVGSATSTGTASQSLQVTGGAYVSGNVGIGTTNPTSRLQVVGDAIITGIATINDYDGNFILDSYLFN